MTAIALVEIVTLVLIAIYGLLEVIMDVPFGRPVRVGAVLGQQLGRLQHVAQLDHVVPVRFKRLLVPTAILVRLVDGIDVGAVAHERQRAIGPPEFPM